MSDKITVSRNREDYPATARAMLAAGADVFYGGDQDAIWNKFFDRLEKGGFPDAKGPDPYQNRARMHLKTRAQ